MLARFHASAATAPITMTAGDRASRARSTMSRTVPLVTRCSGVQPFSITATGVSGFIPAASSPAQIRGSAATPIRMTRVPPSEASARQSAASAAIERVVPGQHRHLPGQPAVGDRDAGRRRHRERAGHARHHLDADARLPAGRGLLAAAAEHVRVAALEPDHPPPGLGVLDEQLVDLVLRHRVPARRLADVDDQHVGSRVRRARPAAPTGRRPPRRPPPVRGGPAG